jgi:hypothetical protein
VGAEVHPHTASHAYRVIEPLAFPVYQPDWRVGGPAAWRPERRLHPCQAAGAARAAQCGGLVRAGVLRLLPRLHCRPTRSCCCWKPSTSMVGGWVGGCWGGARPAPAPGRCAGCSGRLPGCLAAWRLLCMRPAPSARQPAASRQPARPPPSAAALLGRLPLRPGIGNWRAVSDHVGTKKGGEECRQHYLAIYMEPGSRPLPSPAPEMAQVSGGAGASAARGPLACFYPCCTRPSFVPASAACPAKPAPPRPALARRRSPGRPALQLDVRKCIEDMRQGRLSARRPASAKRQQQQQQQQQPSPAVPGPLALPSPAAAASAAAAAAAAAGPAGGKAAKRQRAASPKEEPLEEQGAPGPGPGPADAKPSTLGLGLGLRRSGGAGAGDAEGDELAGGDVEAGPASQHKARCWRWRWRWRCCSGCQAACGRSACAWPAGLPAAALPGPRCLQQPPPPAAAPKPRLTSRRAALQAGAAYELTTYNVKRGEFEHEHDNEAEVVLADMEFREGEPQEEVDRCARPACAGGWPRLGRAHRGGRGLQRRTAVRAAQELVMAGSAHGACQAPGARHGLGPGGPPTAAPRPTPHAPRPTPACRKLRMLEIYNLRLDEREQRRGAARQHGLLNVRRQQALDRKRQPQDKDVWAQCRILARCALPLPAGRRRPLSPAASISAALPPGQLALLPSTQPLPGPLAQPRSASLPPPPPGHRVQHVRLGTPLPAAGTPARASTRRWWRACCWSGACASACRSCRSCAPAACAPLRTRRPSRRRGGGARRRAPAPRPGPAAGAPRGASQGRGPAAPSPPPPPRPLPLVQLAYGDGERGWRCWCMSRHGAAAAEERPGCAAPPPPAAQVQAGRGAGGPGRAGPRPRAGHRHGHRHRPGPSLAVPAAAARRRGGRAAAGPQRGRGAAQLAHPARRGARHLRPAWWVGAARPAAGLGAACSRCTAATCEVLKRAGARHAAAAWAAPSIWGGGGGEGSPSCSGSVSPGRGGGGGLPVTLQAWSGYPSGSGSCAPAAGCCRRTTWRSRTR